MTSLIMLSFSDIYSLINYASFVEALFIGMSVGGLLILRVTRPALKRPIKVTVGIIREGNFQIIGGNQIIWKSLGSFS